MCVCIYSHAGEKRVKSKMQVLRKSHLKFSNACNKSLIKDSDLSSLLNLKDLW